MKKRVFILLALAAFAAGGVFGQEGQAKQEEPKKNEGLWAMILNNQGFAPGIEGAKFFINGGVGLEFPLFSGVVHDMPPLSASVDYVLPGSALSVGGKFAFSTLKYSGTAIDDSAHIDFALRAAFHSNILKQIENLDVSALMLLGFALSTGDAYKVIKNFGYATNLDGFYLGLGLGSRYFFTKNIGVFLEADVKLIMKWSIGASAGLALKF